MYQACSSCKTQQNNTFKPNDSWIKHPVRLTHKTESGRLWCYEFSDAIHSLLISPYGGSLVKSFYPWYSCTSTFFPSEHKKKVKTNPRHPNTPSEGVLGAFWGVQSYLLSFGGPGCLFGNLLQLCVFLSTAPPKDQRQGRIYLYLLIPNTWFWVLPLDDDTLSRFEWIPIGF